MKKLVFTDLDGSLLDHHNYDYSPALPAIKALHDLQIPWILTTSKTAEEVICIRDELSNPYPFIVENGAGIFWPAQCMNFTEQFKHDWLQASDIQTWGTEFEYIRLNKVSMDEMLALANRYKKEFGLIFTGFSDMNVQQVADCTGLTLEQSAKAKQRHFSEPLLWRDTEMQLQRFAQAIKPFGLQLIKGGRFVHLMGLSNKGLALKFLADYYAQLTLHLPDELFGFWRQSLMRHQSIFVINNVTNQPQTLSLAQLNLIDMDEWKELISDQMITDLYGEILLAPYQTVWISNRW